MLQSVPSAIKNAFRGSFIKKICNYLHDCVREEVKSSTFRNLKGDKENKWAFLDGEEQVFSKFGEPLMLNGTDSYLTELMIQSEMNQKDKYLIYGFLFLVGKNGKSKKNNEFLTPILYAPAKLERVGINIQLSIQEDVLSLNTGAISQGNLIAFINYFGQIANALIGLARLITIFTRIPAVCTVLVLR